jgi:hypothetical protein
MAFQTSVVVQVVEMCRKNVPIMNLDHLHGHLLRLLPADTGLVDVNSSRFKRFGVWQCGGRMCWEVSMNASSFRLWPFEFR